MFTVVEGVDGCGKSTQADMLAKHLGAHYMKFPDSSSRTGKIIYQHLEKKWHARPLDASLENDGSAMNALVFQCLQFANRLERAEEIQRTRVLPGGVVSDRYLASAITYGAADGIPMEYLISTQKTLPQPDLNILIDIPIEESVKRRPERRDRYEEDSSFLESVMANYNYLWSRMMKEEPGDWAIINGNRPKEEVHRDIVEAVMARRDIQP